MPHVMNALLSFFISSETSNSPSLFVPKSFDRTRHARAHQKVKGVVGMQTGQWGLNSNIGIWLFVLFSRENAVCLSENGFSYCDFFSGAAHAIQAFKFGAPIFISLTTPTTTQIRQNRHINKVFP